jgi:hypothetical protein
VHARKVIPCTPQHGDVPQFRRKSVSGPVTTGPVDPFNRLFHNDKWILAFAGMTLRLVSQQRLSFLGRI